MVSSNISSPTHSRSSSQAGRDSGFSTAIVPGACAPVDSTHNRVSTRVTIRRSVSIPRGVGTRRAASGNHPPNPWVCADGCCAGIRLAVDQQLAEGDQCLTEARQPQQRCGCVWSAAGHTTSSWGRQPRASRQGPAGKTSPTTGNARCAERQSAISSWLKSDATILQHDRQFGILPCVRDVSPTSLHDRNYQAGTQTAVTATPLSVGGRSREMETWPFMWCVHHQRLW